MPPSLLKSQFTTLEPPDETLITVSVDELSPVSSHYCAQGTFAYPPAKPKHAPTSTPSLTQESIVARIREAVAEVQTLWNYLRVGPSGPTADNP